jgi:flagellar hook-basal body complex protein FliE
MNISGLGIEQLGKLQKPSDLNKTDGSFGDIINDQIEKLNQSQMNADNMTEAFIQGDIDDLHAVMIATEEARLSLDLALQVRNKVVEAYKEINNIQL